MKPLGKDAGNIPAEIRGEIEEYLTESGAWTKSVSDLTPKEALDAYLTWNGIIRYTDEVITVVEALGWRRPEDKDNG